MTLKHVVESQQFTVPLLMELFDRSRLMERIVARGGTLDYQNRILASLFYQPSTRTRFSFEAAMHRLGGRVLSTEHARAFSSEIEGEQVEDSIRIIGSYCDVIVIRHHETGGAARAAKVSPVPIINAGDGDGGQHPTQALLDLYTIYRERPLDGLSVAFIGELDRGRTVRSLAYLLAKFERVKDLLRQPARTADEARHPAISRPARRALRTGAGHRSRGRRSGCGVPDAHPAGAAAASRRDRMRYAIDSTVLQRMRSDAMILHPLPRTVELDKTVDDDPRALYFRQAANGLYVRMALLTMLLE